MTFVAHELSFDSFHKNKSRIQLIYSHVKFGTDTVIYPLVSYFAGPRITHDDPKIESFLRTYSPLKSVTLQNASRPENKYSEPNLIFADSNFFSFFSFPLLAGTQREVLRKPYSMVITQNAAKKYFGTQSPIGQSIKFENEYTFEITGISKDPPSNSSIHYDFIASLSSKLSMKGSQYFINQPEVTYGDFKTYLLLKKNAKPEQVLRNIQNLSQKNKSGVNVFVWFYLKPLTDLHLDQDLDYSANKNYINLFSVIALVILLLALFNYVSLATARATLRAKEIGVRKIVGARKSEIALQFYIESAMYTIISFFIGIVLFIVFRSYLFSLIDLEIDQSFVWQPRVIGIFFVLFILIILLSGIYPAFILSAYKPLNVVFGNQRKQNSGLKIRNVFTVFQFTICIIMVIFSITISKQLFFIRHTNTGLNRKNTLMVSYKDIDNTRFGAFMKNMDEVAGIDMTSIARYPMYKEYNIFSVSTIGNEKVIAMPSLIVDTHFISMMQIQWSIPPNRNSLFTAITPIVLTEAAVAQLNLTSNPINTRLKIMGSDNYEIIGVIKNFNYNSFNTPTQGMCLLICKDNLLDFGADSTGCLFLKINPASNLQLTISRIKKIYSNYFTTMPFEFQFMDDAFDAIYQNEDRLSNLVKVFTSIVIIISSLGILGLSAFSATQRKKEIGIRKVLGSSVKSIIKILLTKFILLIFLAIIIGTPIAWFVTNSWLENFAYRITINVWMLILPGLTLLIVSLITVSLVVINAAVANPVISLKAE